MTFERLEKNICDNIYEAQLKLGYDQHPMSLNYTNATLCHLIGINDTAQLSQLLESFADSVAQKLGSLSFRSTHNGFCITIPAEGTAYVSEHSSGNEFMAKMSRQHNDANVLAFGARVVGKGVALGMVDAFFEEEFLGGRHETRVNKIKAYEEKVYK